MVQVLGRYFTFSWKPPMLPPCIDSSPTSKFEEHPRTPPPSPSPPPQKKMFSTHVGNPVLCGGYRQGVKGFSKSVKQWGE